MAAGVKLLVGTRKGAFIYTSDERRERWSLSEPILPGWSVYHMSADLRGGAPRLYAAANHWAWGRSVAKSADLGKSWDWRSSGLGFPQDMGVTVQNVWHVCPGHESEPGVVYAGTQPAGLFRSEDGGQTWQPVDAINRHALRADWSGTGGGDSSIHSIELDPRDARRMYVAISAGGSYVTSDGGDTWDLFSHTAIARTQTAREFIKAISEQFPQELPPGVDPMAINEMHKMRLDPKDPDRMWAQTHVGVFRSDDRGGTWDDVTQGLPSFHGFPIAITRRAPDAVYVVPLEFEADNFRVCPGQFTVYRTRDGGASWQALTEGLPGPDDYQSVYREGLDTDGLDPEGVYAGTSNGQVYASADSGDRWRRLPGTLPPILSVTAVKL
ncbi:MAG: WD40/YVTN/BNR-like repeat-containing protein [Dehalococcoidia bacterium]